MALDEAGASRRSAASTAEGAALLRAAGTLEPDPKVRNPDEMAHRFVGWGLRLPALVKVPALRRLTPLVVERMIPGAYFFETARTLHLDAVVRREVARGITQLVLLGAGYDSRPYRMGDELRDVAVYEVDLPAMSVIKREKVRSIAGDPPANVRYVEVDFTRQDVRERLAAHGYDLAAPTLLLWSGVAPYLPESAVREVLEDVAAHRSPVTSIVFDYCWREVLEGDDSFFYGARELLARVAELGEPLRSGIPRGETASFLRSCGLVLEEDLGPDDATERYLIRSDGRVYGRPYGFGGLAHARTASS